MKRRLMIAGIAALLALTGLSVYRCHAMRARNAVDSLIQKKKIINILVAGGNSSTDNRHPFFAIVSINPDNNRIGVTFIPPSFRIRLDEDGDNVTRIDQVVAFNYHRLRYTLQKELKLSIPFHVEIVAKDVERIVDLIEGIDLFVLDQTKEIPPSGVGTSYFDGGKVVRYINSVEQNSIYLKYDRILDVLMTLYSERERLERLNNADFVREVMKSVKTNLLPQEIIRIGEVVMKEGDVMFTVLPGFFKDGYYVMDDITYRIYEKEFLANLIVERNEKEIDAAIKIKILNGTGVPGLARKMRESLIRDGMNVVEFGTAASMKLGRSIIVNRRASVTAVNRVAELTGIKNIYHVIDSTQLHNVLVIIGEDLPR